MIDEQYELFDKTLVHLRKYGFLSEIILIGSWCLYFYRRMFNNSADIPAVRTVDLDFLIPNPPNIKTKIVISLILKELGFLEEFSHISGDSKFIHPDLEIEFLINEKGKRREGPFYIKEVNVNAQRMRFMSMLQMYILKIEYKGYELTVPKPGAFVLNKFLISNKRKNEEKKIKDIETAIELGEFLMTYESHSIRIKEIFNSLQRKGQKEIINVVKVNTLKMYDLLI